MQVEKIRYDENPVADFFREGLESRRTYYLEPKPFRAMELEAELDKPDTVAVHIFKATPRNVKFAKLRAEYPDATRRKLRRLMKK